VFAHTTHTHTDARFHTHADVVAKGEIELKGAMVKEPTPSRQIEFSSKQTI